ncbi:MAG: hemerythrin domain-containing protein, partial [Magnetospirillum sp.]
MHRQVPPPAATVSFRRHHHQMRDMMGRIYDMLDVGRVERDPGAVATILRELFGKFSIHLALEDRLLYPKLRSWPVPHLQVIADRFEIEMGGMKAEFDSYRRSWPGPQAISRDPARFVAETVAVLGALEQRI